MNRSETPARRPRSTSRTIVLVAPTFGKGFGGEAIKAYQYAHHLAGDGYDFRIVTHEAREDGLADFDAARCLVIRDDWVQVLLWKSVVLRFLLSLHFHWSVNRLIRRLELAPETHLLHYISPISPVDLRLPPRGYEVVIGPVNKNPRYPPAFRDRMPASDRLRDLLHRPVQFALSRLTGEKRRARAVLVSGYDRTAPSLLLAGCRPEQLRAVEDAGVNKRFASRPRLRHEGVCERFLFMARLVDLKGADLAIRAIAEAAGRLQLDIVGDGACRAMLEQLARDLGVAGQVRFCGWMSHEEMIPRLGDYRGFVLPALSEANGIAIQEAMMIGLPVVTLNWGGPGELGDAESILYVEPEGEEYVVARLADAMTRLAADADLAERLSVRAREIAQSRFTWEVVAQSWEAAYAESPDGDAAGRRPAPSRHC